MEKSIFEQMGGTYEWRAIIGSPALLYRLKKSR